MMNPAQSETKISGSGKKTKWIFWLPSVLLVVILLLFAKALFAAGYVDFLMHGPRIVQEVPSPDGQYTAYVKDLPALDGPNQSLMIERKDQTHFLRLAKLTGDVDSIKEILWAPDSSFVVYHSHLYLTAARISDWQTIRIYLGKEWRRAEPKRRTTFCNAMPCRFVEEINFPEPGMFTYRLCEDDKLHTVRMDVPE